MCPLSLRSRAIRWRLREARASRRRQVGGASSGTRVLSSSCADAEAWGDRSCAALARDAEHRYAWLRDELEGQGTVAPRDAASARIAELGLKRVARPWASRERPGWLGVAGQLDGISVEWDLTCLPGGRRSRGSSSPSGAGSVWTSPTSSRATSTTRTPTPCSRTSASGASSPAEDWGPAPVVRLARGCSARSPSW